MEQYIKKSDVVAEIEKRLKANGAFDEVGDEAWAEDKGMCEAYRSILSFLDTLEVKEVEVPVSNDLEEASYNFVMNNFGNPKEPLYKFDQRCFKAGAQWQKQQMIDKACEWQRQHMKTLPELLNKDLTKHTLWKRDEIIDNFRQAMEG